MVDKYLMKQRIKGEREYASRTQIAHMVNAVDTIIDWHPYPQENPTEMKRYLVTVIDGGYTYTDIWYWVGHSFENNRTLVEGKVIAWAELPKPYEG